LSGMGRVPAISGTLFEDWNNNGVREASEPGASQGVVFLDQNNNGVLDRTPLAALESSDVPLSIPDPGQVSSSLEVSGVAGQVYDVAVTLTIKHSWDDDLSVSLIGPTGVRVALFAGVGSDADDFANTTLSDQAAVTIAEGEAPFTGQFR